MKNNHALLVQNLLNDIKQDDILDFCTVLNDSGLVLVAGNGGSASTAEHFTVDLLKACKIPAIALSANSAVMTALANDNGYERVFLDQLEKVANSMSCVFCVSTSGNSKNVVNVAKWAWENNIPVLSLVAFSGGDLVHYSDYAIHVKTDTIEAAEDVHNVVCHAIVRELKSA